MASLTFLLVLLAIAGVFLYDSMVAEETEIAFFRLENRLNSIKIDNDSNTREAISLIDAFTAKHSSPIHTERLIFYRARLLAESGRFDEAVADLEKLLATEEELPGFFYTLVAFYLSDVYIRSGKPEVAATKLEQFDAGTMEDIRRFTLGRIYLTIKETEKAKNEFQFIVANFPNSPFGQRARALLNSLR